MSGIDALPLLDRLGLFCGAFALICAVLCVAGVVEWIWARYDRRGNG